jgi:hypothetical protein
VNMSKTIIQAHKDALAAARWETHFESHVDKVVQAYLKSMMDDGFVIMPKDSEVTFDEVNEGNGKNC